MSTIISSLKNKTKSITDSELSSKANSAVGRAVNRVMDYIFPPRCPICDKVITIDEKGKICKKCQGKIHVLDDGVCLKCGRKIRDKRDEYCKSCRARRHVFSQGKVLFEYEGEIRESLHRYKYANRREYSICYGRMACQRYYDWMLRRGIDIIVPVPMYDGKRRFRGYNQAELFARCLSKDTGIPFSNAVARIKNTKPQAGMNELERKNNLQNAFKITADIVEYKKILLVDDIYTTGSTVDELARVLLAAQAYEIFVLCIASGEG